MKSGVQITSAVVLVGVIVWLFIRIEGYKDAQANQQREANRLKWLLSAKEAENDSIKLMAEYSEPDTIWDSIPVPYAVYNDATGETDTLYKKVPWAKLFGLVKFDTTAEIGPKSNPLKVRVKGWLYYPKEYEYLNRLLVYPVAGKPPTMPVTTSRKSVGIGLNYLRAFNQHDYLGVSVRYKRFSVIGSYDPWRKSLIVGGSYEWFTF